MYGWLERRNINTQNGDASGGRKPNSIFALSSRIMVDPKLFNHFREDDLSTNIPQGTLRLVNLIVKNETDTVFFLDRSARPAYVLFRKLWKELIPEFPLPQVRFISVGSDNKDQINAAKSSQQASIAKALAMLYKLDNPRKILVADEYAYSSQSLKTAHGFIEQMYPKAQVLSTGIYTVCPKWYGKMAMLMNLEDPPYNNPLKTRSFFSQRYKKSAYESVPILEFRAELYRLAQIIAQHTTVYPVGSFPVEPLVP